MYENQRCGLVTDWEPTELPDRYPFTYVESGAGYNHLEGVPPPEGHVWVSSDWFVDADAPHTDDDGWEYGPAAWDKAGIFGWASTYNRLIHFTRRRKLLRRHKRVPSSMDEVRACTLIDYADVRVDTRERGNLTKGQLNSY